MRLLVMSCGSKKSLEGGSIPAFDRYTGPSYSILKKAKENQEIEPTEIVIISAKFGLLRSNEPIPNYDLRMTEGLALMHRSKVVAGLKGTVDFFKPKEIFLFLSPVYGGAVMPMGEWAGDIPYCFVKGGLGYRNQFLKNWYIGKTHITTEGLVDKSSLEVLISTQETHSKLRL